ncbi:MAG: Bax inhibitor-1 family protein [bacterium]
MPTYNQQAMQGAEHYGVVPAGSAGVSERQGFLAKVYMTVGAGLFVAGVAAIATLGSPTLMNGILGLLRIPLLYIAVIFGITFGVQAVSTKPGINVVAYGIYAWFLGMVTAPLVMYVVAQTGTFATVYWALALTTALFGGLTLWALSTREDLSGWGRYLMYGAWAMFGVVIVALIFNLAIGLWYNAVWVALISGFVMYETQMIQRRFPTTMWMSASIALMTDFIVMFWHILSLLGRRR